MNGFKTCTTDQLTLQEKQGICTLISQIFGIERTVEYFDREFSHNCKKYSYHCIYQKDSQVLASFCIVPRRYKVAGRTEFFGLSVDTAVSPEAHLGPFGIADMAAEAEALAQKDGCKVLYGFPNDNFYEYNVAILQREDLGFLDFYVVLQAPGQLKKYLKWLDFSRYFLQFWLFLFKTFSSGRVQTYPVEKEDNEEFRTWRYDSNYQRVRFAGGEAVYTLYREKFGMVAYIVDITPLSAKNFYSAFYHISREVKSRAAIIAYPGNKLAFGNLFRVPHRFLPRKLHLVAAGMASGDLPESCRKIANWKINLSDFDVR